MYHTTKDLIVGTRALGIDAGFIDAAEPTAKTDGIFSCDRPTFADTADLYMLHLMIPEPYFSDGTPIVFALHGHPLYSMQIELYGTEPGNDRPFTTLLSYFNRKEPSWFVSFWEREQRGFWTPIDDTRKQHRIRYIPRGIDFDANRLSVDGTRQDLVGDPVIVIADQFRLFKDAIPSIYAAYAYWRRNPKARVHLYAMPPIGSRQRETIDRWLQVSGVHRCIGSVNGIENDLPSVLRAADVLVSTVTGESRVLLEAQACGCATVAPCPEADYQCNEFWLPDKFSLAIGDAIAGGCDDAARRARAAHVREAYRIERTAEALAALYKEILG
jgi:glycosyltransferase involved in cell wall biosynthesis